MLTLFYFLVLEQILQGLYNLWDGLRWLRLAQRRAGKPFRVLRAARRAVLPGERRRAGARTQISPLWPFDYSDYEIFFTMAERRRPGAQDHRTRSPLPANTKFTS